MYACTSKPGADFPRGCVGELIGHSILKTPPPIRESSPASAGPSKGERGQPRTICPPSPERASARS
jgi:hypothetical protein